MIVGLAVAARPIAKGVYMRKMYLDAVLDAEDRPFSSIPVISESFGNRVLFMAVDMIRRAPDAEMATRYKPKASFPTKVRMIKLSMVVEK